MFGTFEKYLPNHLSKPIHLLTMKYYFIEDYNIYKTCCWFKTSENYKNKNENLNKGTIFADLRVIVCHTVSKFDLLRHI